MSFTFVAREQKGKSKKKTRNEEKNMKPRFAKKCNKKEEKSKMFSNHTNSGNCWHKDDGVKPKFLEPHETKIQENYIKKVPISKRYKENKMKIAKFNALKKPSEFDNIWADSENFLMKALLSVWAEIYCKEFLDSLHPSLKDSKSYVPFSDDQVRRKTLMLFTPAQIENMSFQILPVFDSTMARDVEEDSPKTPDKVLEGNENRMLRHFSPNIPRNLYMIQEGNGHDSPPLQESTAVENYTPSREESEFNLGSRNSVQQAENPVDSLSSFFSSQSKFPKEKKKPHIINAFLDWPSRSISYIRMAENGSLGEEVNAQCCECHVVRHGWKVEDNPEHFHVPNCRYV